MLVHESVPECMVYEDGLSHDSESDRSFLSILSRTFVRSRAPASYYIGYERSIAVPACTTQEFNTFPWKGQIFVIVGQLA